MMKWQRCGGAVRTLGGGPHSRHGCSALCVCTASCTLLAHCVFLIWQDTVISPSAQRPAPPSLQRCLRSISPMMLGPSASCLLTVFGGLKNLGVACRSELQLLMCRICDSQRAAVLQHRPAEVRGDRWVHTASLRPEGRDWKDRGGGCIGINKRMNCTWGWYCRGVALDLRCRLLVSTGQLVGDEASQLSAHLPATHHRLLSVQHTMHSGNLPSI